MTSTFRSELLRVFAQDFGPARWHRPNTALRFELGVGDDADAYLSVAYRRCEALLAAVFSGRPVHVELTLWAEDESQRQHTLEHLASVGAPGPAEWEFEEVTYEDDGPVTEHRASVRLRLEPSLRAKVVRIAVGADHGRDDGRRVAVFVFDPDRRVLLHPYDSRGADLYGTTADDVRPYYLQFNAWLLDFNRAEADAWMFGNALTSPMDPLVVTIDEAP